MRGSLGQAAVGAVGMPVNAGPASKAPPAEERSAEPRDTAPLRPLKLTTPAPDPPSSFKTNAVVANCVVLVPNDAVGAVGVPINAGLARTAPPAAVTSAVVRVTAPIRPLKVVTPSAAKAAITKAVVAS